MELNSVLEFDKQNMPFTLIESNTDGQFLVHYLISNCIRHTHAKTFLITLSQTLSHFKSVQAKLGNSTQLNNCITNGKFFNFDLMNKFSSHFYFNEQDDKFNSVEIFNEVLIKIESLTTKSEDPEEKYFVIIDDLSIANLIGITDNSLLEFLTRLQSISDKLNLILCIQSFYSNKYLINDLSHISDLYIKVENLSTGYSKEITGQMKLYKLPIISNRKEEKYLYKVNERSVQLFPI